MKTRLTELLGIEHPLCLSGMSWISVPEMVAAVSNAGGLGILATGPLDPQGTREAIRRVRELTDRPFGANATLLFPGAAANARVLLEERVPVINFALGKGDWIVRQAHAYGGKVIATVVNARHALRAQEYGVDAVIATGHEAAAHGGELTTFCLIPRLAEILEIPVIAAGGIADGRGLAAALALGAEGAAMGSRFMTTRESPLHRLCKELSLAKDSSETLYSERFDGLPCRVMKTPGALRAVRRGLNIPAALVNSRIIASQLNLPYLKLLIGVLAAGPKKAVQMAYLANGFAAIRRATEEGDVERGVLPVGQAVGLLHDEPPVAELIARIVAEAEDALSRIRT